MRGDNHTIIDGDWDHFITLPGETLLVVKRQHIFILLLTLLFNTFLFSTLISVTWVIFSWLFPVSTLLITSNLLLAAAALTLYIKLFITWYYHLYIVTSRKIVEVIYSPLHNHIVNDVLLNQVNCTEIDVKTHGFIAEILDMGNVLVTFDRPTHQQEFLLLNIHRPKETAALLSKNLSLINNFRWTMPLWQRTPDKTKPFRFIGDLFLGRTI